MSKPRQGKGKPSRRKKKTQIWQLLLAVVVVIGMASSWIFLGGGGSTKPADTADADEPMQPIIVPGLEDRMVLPAKPQRPRPVTLSPAAFSDQPEVQASYQAAKDSPEALESVACYCGCFGNAGHRNNLDCYKDNHGVTWAICRSIALEAQRQYKLGTPTAQIKRAIDERYAPRIR